jgi:hypothetical protein
MIFDKLLSRLRNIIRTLTFSEMEAPMITRGRERRRSPWDDAPPWAHDLADMVFAVMMQNEDMLALLQKRTSKLSPEDQAAVDAIVAESTRLRKEIDDAMK